MSLRIRRALLGDDWCSTSIACRLLPNIDLVKDYPFTDRNKGVVNEFRVQT